MLQFYASYSPKCTHVTHVLHLILAFRRFFAEQVMDSKKKPLWLVFENADPNGERYLAIFKVKRSAKPLSIIIDLHNRQGTTCAKIR
jgi:hypothetical protein